MRSRNEDLSDCVKRNLYCELRNIILSSTCEYKIKGGAGLAEAAIEELMSVFSPDHPVLVSIENAQDARVSIYVSMERLERIDFGMVNIVEKLSKKGTQLLMTPYKRKLEDKDFVLPQFPMFVDKEEGDEMSNFSKDEERRCFTRRRPRRRGISES